MPKISVIIYVKNTENYIEQCIQSVLKQTEKDIEIIVVDGGSTDRTVAIIDKLKGHDARIKLFSKTGGVGAQFNYGLEKSTGEYVAVVEADDFIPLDMLEKQYVIAKANDLDVIRAGYYYYLEIDGKSFCYPFMACAEPELRDRSLYNDDGKLFLDVGLNGFWSGLYRRSFLVKNEIHMSETEGASYQDIGFSFLTQLLAKKIWLMSECFYRYRIDNPNASVNSISGIKKHINEYVSLRNELTEKGLWTNYKLIYFRWMIASFEWYIVQFPNEDVTEWVNESYVFLREQIQDYEDLLILAPDEIKKCVKTLIDGKEAFYKYIMEKCVINKRLNDYIHKDFISDKNFVVFGTGNIGIAVLDFLDIYGKNVMLIDNDAKKQNQHINGHSVFPPDKICKDNMDATYIVANTKYHEDMFRQLLDNGIDQNSIVICNDRGFWLRKILPLAGGKIDKKGEME